MEYVFLLIILMIAEVGIAISLVRLFRKISRTNLIRISVAVLLLLAIFTPRISEVLFGGYDLSYLNIFQIALFLVAAICAIFGLKCANMLLVCASIYAILYILSASILWLFYCVESLLAALLLVVMFFPLALPLLMLFITLLQKILTPNKSECEC